MKKQSVANCVVLAPMAASPANAFKRLLTEYKQLALNAPEGIAAGPIDEEDFFLWYATGMKAASIEKRKFFFSFF